MTPIGPFLKARRTLTAGPPRPPILASSGDRMPRQFGPMMRAPRSLRQLDHLRHLAARDALGDDDDELDAGLDRLEDGVAREARRHGDDRAVDVHLRR